MSRIEPVCCVLVCVIVVACGGAEPERVTRIVGGERRVGIFVSPFAYEWFVRGELAAERGDLDRAIEAYRMARTGPEDDPLVMARLADVLDRRGMRRESEEVVEEGLELFPNAEALWVVRGDIAQRHGAFEGAIDAYARAEETAPSSDEAPLRLFQLLCRMRQTSRAEQVIRHYVQRVGGGSPAALRARLALAVQRGDANAAVRSVEALMRVAPARMDDVHKAAQVAIAAGRPSLAARILDRVPRHPGDEALRVRALIASGHRERAEGVLATAEPDVFGGLTNQAALYLEVGRPERAEELAEAALAIAPDPHARVVAGRALLAQERYTEAAQHFALVPNGVEGFASARVGLAQALEAQGLRGLAAETLADALARPNDDPETLREALTNLRQ